MKKKTLALTMAMALVLSLAACGNSNADVAAESTAAATTEAATEAATTEAATEASTEAAEAVADEKSEGVMTYEEYMAADLDSEVVIEAYVQAKQSCGKTRLPCTPRIRTVLTSFIMPHVPKRIMQSWYPVPRSK